mmetsp:Transcript_81012/g.185474  ORF Transcript_81012/g.185474 Transcript_81012/m.185474 type:complete len:430 (+) Transcript_81012:83-1372(+)
MSISRMRKSQATRMSLTASMSLEMGLFRLMSSGRKEFDTDGSGEIEFEEFLCMLIRLTGRRIRADKIDYLEYLTDQVIEKYTDMFRKIDKDGGGTIEKVELRPVFETLGLDLTEDQLEEVFEEVDADGSGTVEFDEFCCLLAKLTNPRKRIFPREYLTSEQMCQYQRQFDYFDISKDGSVEKKEVGLMFKRLGIVLTSQQLDAIVAEFDEDGSGEIEFEEFCVMMIKLKKERRFRRIKPAEADVNELLKEGFSVKELKAHRFDAPALRAAGCPALALSKAGYSPLILAEAGYNAKELRKANISAKALKEAGFSLAELRNAGFCPRLLRKVCRDISEQTLLPLFPSSRTMPHLGTEDEDDAMTRLPRIDPSYPECNPRMVLPPHMTPRIKQTIQGQRLKKSQSDSRLPPATFKKVLTGVKMIQAFRGAAC